MNPFVWRTGIESNLIIRNDRKNAYKMQAL